LIPQLKAWENVALPLKYAKVRAKERKERALALLVKVGLSDRAEHYPSELSGGQEQRVAIARALVIRPKLVLADEPTGNLDTASGERVLELLDELQAGGSTLITVTHSPEVARRAERVVRVVDGRVVD
jgi:putative ABC transport system ATP-binding protein